MHPSTLHKFIVNGPAGKLEAAANDPGENKRAGIAVIAHPHPLFGGTMDNKVIQTLAKTFFELNYVAVRFNFRGVGKSEGVFDEGVGETEDVLAVVDAARHEYGDLPLLLAGFSFGGFVQAKVRQRIAAQRLILIAPAVSRFEVPAVPADTLIIHGEFDDTVPFQAALDWARAQNLPIVMVPGGEHFFHGRLNQLKEIVLQYLGKSSDQQTR